MKRFSKRIMALFMAVVMALPVMFAMPSSASADADINSHLRARYFIDKNYTKDNAGNYDLENVNGGNFSWSRGAVKFPGGSSHPYFRVRLNEMLKNVDFNNGLTISFSAKRASSNWERYFELSSGGGYGNGDLTKYLFFSVNGNAKVNNPSGSKSETGTPNVGEDGKWHNWVFVVKNGSFTLYRDGVERGTLTDNRINSDWFNDIRNNGYLLIAASSYSGDGCFDGYMTNFKVYDIGVSSSQVNQVNKDQMFKYSFERKMTDQSGNNEFQYYSWSNEGYESYDDHMYLKNCWCYASAPASIREEENKKNWRIDFEYNFTQSVGGDRLEQILGITNATVSSHAYLGEQSFGVSSNGKVYLNTRDINAPIGDTGINLSDDDTNKVHHIISYAYHNGIINVFIDNELKFSYDASAYTNLFENINTITIGGRGTSTDNNGEGGWNYIDVWDLSAYYFPEAKTIDEHIKGRYFLGDIEQNFISDNYDFNVSGTGAVWQESGGIEGARFNGENISNSPNYLYMPKDRTKSMFSLANQRTGFTFSFMSKSLHSNSWQRIFELSNVDSGYGGGSGNKYIMFSSQYNGSSHISFVDSAGLELNQLGDITNWHQWTVTVQEGAIIIYRDGSRIRTVCSPSLNSSWFNELLTNGMILLGASTFSDPGFDGYIRDLRIYDVALNASQASTVYQDIYNNRSFYDSVSGEELNTLKNNLKSAMSAYENKMRTFSSDFLTNTKAAYDAYVVANRYIDAIECGETEHLTKTQLTRAVNNLNNAINEMGSWSYRVGTAYGTWRDELSSVDYSKYYKNLIWVGDKIDTSGQNNDTSYVAAIADEVATYQSNNNRARSMIYHHSVVMLNDGITEPSTAIMYRVKGYRSSVGNFNQRHYGAWLGNDANGLYMKTNWKGRHESLNFTDTIANYTEEIGISSAMSTYVNTGSTYYAFGNGQYNKAHYANILYFRDTMGETEYSRKISDLKWNFRVSNDNGAYEVLQENIAENGDFPIYIINYKLIREKLANAKTYARNITNYKEGGLETMFRGCDEATGLDLNTDNSWNSANIETKFNSCTSKIKAAVEHINSTKRADVYSGLRNEMLNAHEGKDPAKSDYHSENSYTTSTYSTFKAKYDVAKAEMAELANSGYKTSLGSILSELQGAHHNLVKRADFSALSAKYTEKVNYSNSVIMDMCTLTSVNAFKAALAALPYSNYTDAQKADTPASKQSEIDAETEWLNSEYSSLLDFTKNLTPLTNAYNRADALLLSLDGESPAYTKDQIEDLISAANLSNNYLGATAEEKREFGSKTYGAEIDSVTQTVNDVCDAIEGASTLDLTAFNAVLSNAESIDPDAYQYDPAALASDIKAVRRIVYSSALTYKNATINTLRSGLDQEIADMATSYMLSSLTSHIREYEIDVVEGSVSEIDGITFTGGTFRFDKEENKYYATYGSKVTFRSDCDEAAWYMEYDSETTQRKEKYQDFSKSYSTRVFGNIYIYSKTAQNGNKLTIKREYSDSESTPVQLIDFVSGEYTLPSAPNLAFYNFDGYYMNGERVSSSITVDEDTEIIARYVAAPGKEAYTISYGGEDISASYNEKITLRGNNSTYGWLEAKSGGGYRPFYIGKDVSFLATESGAFRAVDEATFESYTLPVINLRQSGALATTVDAKTKVTFNGQYVAQSELKILEYGILAGKSKREGFELDNSNVVLDNAGNFDDYSLLRAKSTTNVGANQFTISINNLTGDIAYRGYIVYQNENGIQIAYGDTIYQTIEG